MLSLLVELGRLQTATGALQVRQIDDDRLGLQERQQTVGASLASVTGDLVT